MAKYAVGHRVTLHTRSGFYVIVEVLRNKRYTVTPAQGTSAIATGDTVIYQGQEAKVISWISNNLIEIQLQESTIIEVRPSSVDPKRRNQDGGGGMSFEVYESDIKEGFRNLVKPNTFETYKDYAETMDEMVENTLRGKHTEQGQSMIKSTIDMQKTKCINQDKSWFGAKCPKSYKELMTRTEFQEMDVYEKIKKENIKPLVEGLKKQTFADLFKKKLLYNDREIGMFDFNKASINLLQRFIYFSIIHKTPVRYEDVKIVKSKNNNYEYRLKNDNTKVVILPLFTKDTEVDLYELAKAVEDSDKHIIQVLNERNLLDKVQYYSTIKKCYLAKEKKQQPVNAVRIFTIIGGNADKKGEQLMYSAMAAVGVTELLEQLGYNVNLNVCFGVENNGGGIRIVDGGESVYKSGSRLAFFPMKKFDETMDISKIMYLLADPSYFRGKIFQYFLALQSYYGDKIGKGIGRMPDNSQFQNAVFQKFLPIDANKGVMYYFFGNITSVLPRNGKEDTSSKSVVGEIRNLVEQAENMNQMAREMMNLD